MSGFLTVCTGTFGALSWGRLANERAGPSVSLEGLPWIHCYADTLAEARNLALAEVETKFVCFLDADDELEPGYAAALERGTADLRAPSIRQIPEGTVPRHLPRAFMPRVWNHFHDCEAACLRDGNWLIIGTAVRTDLLRSCGGFPEGIEWSEDWAAFARCWVAGGTVEAIPDAVYRAHVRPDSRNHAPTAEFKLAQHRKIERLIWGTA